MIQSTAHRQLQLLPIFLVKLKYRYGKSVHLLRLSTNQINKGKREFMEMLYIKREGTYSINLKTDLVKYNDCYDSMISYL